MRCPYCGNIEDKVLESRTMVNGESIRRRRECLSCGYRFTSYERIDEKPFMVIKSDGLRQPFDREKLEKGIWWLRTPGDYYGSSAVVERDGRFNNRGFDVNYDLGVRPAMWVKI